MVSVAYDRAREILKQYLELNWMQLPKNYWKWRHYPGKSLKKSFLRQVKSEAAYRN